MYHVQALCPAKRIEVLSYVEALNLRKVFSVITTASVK
jgi:hypothetical protein